MIHIAVKESALVNGSPRELIKHQRKPSFISQVDSINDSPSMSVVDSLNTSNFSDSGELTSLHDLSDIYESSDYKQGFYKKCLELKLSFNASEPL
jgi:hypothetical protein